MLTAFMPPPAVLILAPTTWPRWAIMWALAVIIYAGCKGLTWWRTPLVGAPAWKHLAYLVAWPGLDAEAFVSGRVERQPSRADWIRGMRNLASGLILLFAVARLVAPTNAYLAGWIGMIGIVLILHFGLFDLLSSAWRQAGVEARPLMNRPMLSVSLAEFWGRRWNTAFRDLTHRFLFRPMTRRFGAREGIVVGFLFSGVVHDLVISVPAGGGYGGPTLFFVLQAIGMLVERSAFGASMGLARGARGWVFTMLLLIIPAPMLFHPPFVHQIILPFMHALRAL
jgi:hypothetical protein